MKIIYPYLPEEREILYVGENDQFMRAAKEITNNSGCVKQPTGAVIVHNGKIIGRGANSGKKVDICPRWGSKSGENYGPCKDVCNQDGHAEVMAIRNAREQGLETEGTDLYLYGHWWCCTNCWKHIIKAGIKNIYLLDNSWNMFNPDINTEMRSWGKPK